MALTDTDGKELLRVPFAPGKSPFKVKGVAYRGHLDYVERYVPGGTAAMVRQMSDPEMTRFFEQSFLASSMYDVFPIAQAGLACATLTKLSFPQFVRIRSRVQAESDIKGVYKFLMNLVSAEAIAQRIPKIMSQYFDFVEPEVLIVEPKHVEGVQHGIPAPLAPWFALVNSSYLDTVLKLAGATSPRTTIEREGSEGSRDGVPIVGSRFRVVWR